MADAKLAPLFKRTVSGSTQLWMIDVEPQSDGTAVLVTTFGLVDGKQQVQRDHITEGKNTGKRNATTPLTQAYAEAEAQWQIKQSRKGYGLDAGSHESAAKRAASPMLAKTYEDFKDSVDWSCSFGQMKFDGFRCLARREGNAISLVSREGKPITTMEHIAAELMDILDDGDALDGELWTPELNFQQIASAVKRRQEASEKVQYHVYDTPDPVLAFDARSRFLLDLLGPTGSGPICAVETVRIQDHNQLLAFQSRCVADGYEGAMLRHGTAGYEAGKRSKSLLKCKVFADSEFVITGVAEGRGTHAGMAILQCQTAEGYPFECTAPGSHSQKKQAWQDRDKLVGQKVTVKYFSMSDSAQAVPRFPVALRIHETVG